MPWLGRRGTKATMPQIRTIMKPPLNTLAYAADAAERAVKVSACLLGALYVIGLIVVSMRMAQLGVITVELFKPLYMLTGTWACLPIMVTALGYATFAGIQNELRTSFGYCTGSARLVATLRAIATVSVVWLSVVIIADVFSRIVGKSAVGLVVFGDAFDITFALLICLTAAAAIAYTAPCRYFFGDGPLPVSVTLILCVCGLIYLMFFTFTMYGTIPVALGGGGPRLVAMVIDDPAVANEIVGKDHADTRVITCVIAETADQFVIPAPSITSKGYWLSLGPQGKTEWHLMGVTKSKNGEKRSIDLGAKFLPVPKKSIKSATVLGAVTEPGWVSRITGALFTERSWKRSAPEVSHFEKPEH